MNKIMSKLIVSVLALAIAATLTATASYAWLTIAGAPEVNGIQVNIGGSDTIMIAPDMVYTAQDGTVSHYPGSFVRNLNFSNFDTYDYLDGVAGLSPVSTSDGVYWFLPEYYSKEDTAVQNGLAFDGQMKPYGQFEMDTTLKSANQTQIGSDNPEGHYVYLDFWVVSPAHNYELRVSTGDQYDNSGSYVISLMEPVEADKDGDEQTDSYVLQPADDTAVSSIRLGFLVNLDWAKYQDVTYYATHSADAKKYTKLMGQYQEPGESLTQYADAQNRFTVYEPNGDLHPADKENGAYYRITKPLGLVSGEVVQQNIGSILTVQTNSTWDLASNNLETKLAQEFQAAIIGTSFESNAAAQLFSYFYNSRLQGQLDAYMTRGRFIKNTAALYASADPLTGIVDQNAAAMRNTAGATDDVYIVTLQKNIPQRIRMFIWLEGQDADCSNHSSNSNLAVNIEFAGSNE